MNYEVENACGLVGVSQWVVCRKRGWNVDLSQKCWNCLKWRQRNMNCEVENTSKRNFVDEVIDEVAKCTIMEEYEKK